MTFLEITLVPALNGASIDVGYFFDGNWISYPLPPPLPLSVDGEFVFTFVPGSSPGIIFQVRIPEQTINGITYAEAFSTNGWNDLTNLFTETIILTEIVTPPPPPPPFPIPYVEILVPLSFGLVVMWLFSR